MSGTAAGAAARRQNEAEAVAWAPRCWHLDSCLACLSVTVLVPVQDPRPQIHGQCLSFCSIIAGNTTQNRTDALHVNIKSGCHAMSWSGVNWTPCAPGTSLIFYAPPPNPQNNSTGEMLLLHSIYGFGHETQRT